MKIYHVAAGIIWQNGHYLAAKRPEDKIMAGYYEFPGGKIEAGETSYQALVRELNEELSIKVSKAKFWRSLTHSKDNYQVIIDFFNIVEYTGVIKANEGQEWLFVLPNEAKKLNFLPADLPIVEELENVAKKIYLDE